MSKTPKTATLTTRQPQNAVKQYKDNPHSDTTINNVGKLISLQYRNVDISKMLNIDTTTVSRIRSYLRRISWCSNDFTKLAHDNVKEALKNGDIKLSEKVLDEANKQIAPQPHQQRANTPIQVNISTVLDELVYRPSAQIDVTAQETALEGDFSSNAGSSMCEDEIVDCRGNEGLGGSEDE
jgi:hypothetical protein